MSGFVVRHGIFAIFGSVLMVTAASANFIPQSKLCDKMTTDGCALAVKNAITGATTPEAAAEAWGAWVEAYEIAYRKFEGAPVPASDLDKIEDKISDKIDDYTKPENVALNLALKRYLPRIAAFFEFLDGPEVLLVTGILSPSPLVTPIQELNTTNDEIGRLVSLKITPFMSSDWKTNYGAAVKDVFDGPEIRKP
jgi:hypothetical protein